MKCDKIEIKGKNKVHIQSCLQIWNVLPPTSIVKASYSSLASVWSVFSLSDSTLTLIYTPDRMNEFLCFHTAICLSFCQSNLFVSTERYPCRHKARDWTLFISMSLACNRHSLKFVEVNVQKPL